MKKETNLQEIVDVLGESIMESYDWEKNKDQVGLMVIVADKNNFKAGIVGHTKHTINAIINGMLKDDYFREIITTACNTYMNYMAENIREKEISIFQNMKS